MVWRALPEAPDQSIGATQYTAAARRVFPSATFSTEPAPRAGVKGKVSATICCVWGKLRNRGDPNYDGAVPIESMQRFE